MPDPNRRQSLAPAVAPMSNPPAAGLQHLAEARRTDHLHRVAQGRACRRSVLAIDAHDQAIGEQSQGFEQPRLVVNVAERFEQDRAIEAPWRQRLLGVAPADRQAPSRDILELSPTDGQAKARTTKIANPHFQWSAPAAADIINSPSGSYERIKLR